MLKDDNIRIVICGIKWFFVFIRIRNWIDGKMMVDMFLVIMLLFFFFK